MNIEEAAKKIDIFMGMLLIRCVADEVPFGAIREDLQELASEVWEEAEQANINEFKPYYKSGNDVKIIDKFWKFDKIESIIKSTTNPYKLPEGGE